MIHLSRLFGLGVSVLVITCDEQLKKWPCHSVCVSVRPYVLSFLLVSVETSTSGMSYSVIWIWSSPKEFQWCFWKGVWSFKGVSRKLQGCFHEVLRVFTKSLKSVSRKFKGCFKEVLRVFQESFRENSWLF